MQSRGIAANNGPNNSKHSAPSVTAVVSKEVAEVSNEAVDSSAAEAAEVSIAEAVAFTGVETKRQTTIFTLAHKPIPKPTTP